jgi:hypothetical protein
MTVNLSALAGAGQQFLDDSGNVLTGGKLYSYAAGTTTPQATFTSVSGATAHSNPIILNAAGRVATGEIWLTAGLNYKFVLYTSTDVLVASWDNITGINGTGIATSAANVSFTGFKSQSGTVQDLADDDGSDWIGFEPAGTNSVARSAQDKIRETVSVKDFGAVGDGVADDTAAVQAAIDAVSANGGGILFFPSGDYICNLQIEIKDNVFIKGSGPNATTLNFSQKGYYSNTEGMIIVKGTGATNEVSVTASVAEGAVAIPVSSIAGFAPNDYVKLRSTEVYWSEATVGEICHVQWADSGTVYLKHPTSYSYDSGAGTLTLVKANFYRGGISDLAILGSGINPAGQPSPPYTGNPNLTSTGSQRGDLGIEVRYGQHWCVDNVQFKGVEYRCVTFFSCVDSSVRNSLIEMDSINVLSQYGVSIFGANANTVIANNHFYNGRHHVTTNSSAGLVLEYTRGMPTGVVMEGNVCKGAWTFPLDTHNAGSGVVISNNTIESLSGGVNMRCKNALITSNTIILPIPNTAIPGIVAAHGISLNGEMKNITIQNNNIVGGNLGIYGRLPNTTGDSITISNNIISNTNGACVQLADTNNFVISGNICNPISGTAAAYIRVEDNCKFGAINNNVIKILSSASRNGVLISATNLGDSTSIAITSNVIINMGGGGFITGINLDNNVTNSLVGVNETSTCTRAYAAGTNTTNTFVGRNYAGTITIASGVIDCPLEATSFAIDTEAGAATDDLDTINEGAQGQVVTLKSVTNARVPTLKDNTGNLQLAGDFVLSNSVSTITLIKIGNNWLEVSRSTN